MSDKEKFKAEISRLQDLTMDKYGNFNSAYDQGKYDVLCILETFVDSMQEEAASEGLEEAWRAAYDNEKDEILVVYDHYAGFVAGVNWREKQMMKDAVPCKIEYKDKWHINLITDDKIMEEYTERMAFKCRDKGKLIIIKKD